jgi:hypothetical protein
MISEVLNPVFLKPALEAVHEKVKSRIFDDGLAADGSQIGQYSEGYLAQRRKKGLGGSSKVIFQFTGAMKKDFVLLNQGGDYGSGFNNQENGDKSFWVESTYDKEVFQLTNEEEASLIELINQRVQNVIIDGR